MKKLLAGTSIGIIATAGVTAGAVYAVNSQQVRSSKVNLNNVYDHDIDIIGSRVFEERKSRIIEHTTDEGKLYFSNNVIAQNSGISFLKRTDSNELEKPTIYFENIGKVTNYKYKVISGSETEATNDFILKGTSSIVGKIIEGDVLANRKEVPMLKAFPTSFPDKNTPKSETPSKESFWARYQFKFDGNDWFIRSKRDSSNSYVGYNYNPAWERTYYQNFSSWTNINSSTMAYLQSSTFHTAKALRSIYKSNSRSVIIGAGEINFGTDRAWSVAISQESGDLKLKVASNSEQEAESFQAFVGNFKLIDPTLQEKVAKVHIIDASRKLSRILPSRFVTFNKGTPSQEIANALYSAYISGSPFKYLRLSNSLEKDAYIILDNLNANFKELHVQGITKVSSLSFGAMLPINAMKVPNNDVLKYNNYFRPSEVIVNL